MILPVIVEDFPVGCTVKVVRLPRHTWKSPRILGAVGTVVNHFDDLESNECWVDVLFPSAHVGEIFRPWWLERGHSVWVPCDKAK